MALVTLSLDQSEVNESWIGFSLENLEPFQYYRISIYDPDFYSISRLELYTSP